MGGGGKSAALTELTKRRDFLFGSSEAYGGIGGFYTYGPQSATLKSNVEKTQRERFAVREGNLEIEALTIMPEPIFEASGHLDGSDDMPVEYARYGGSHRAGHLIEDNSELEDAGMLSSKAAAEEIADLDLVCPTCDADLAGQPAEDFNLMLGTDIDPGSSTPGYLRPEMAQGIFAEFPRTKEYVCDSLPFGVTQAGRAHRNEISPRKSIVRTHEFTQTGLKHFIDPERDGTDLPAVGGAEVLLYPAAEQETDDGDYAETTIGEAVDDGIIGDAQLGYFLGIAQEWYETVGADMDRFRFRQHLADERARYSSGCQDAENEVDGSWIEIAGFSRRNGYGLSKHDEYDDDDFAVFQQYDEPKAVERAVVDPDMATLGPKFGAQVADVAEALETLAERDPDTFDADEVALDIDGEEITVDTDMTNFTAETQAKAGEYITPHVVEPSFSIGRTAYTFFAHAYETDEVDGEAQSYLSLSPSVVPTNVGVFPLVSNVDGLVDLADDVAKELYVAGFAVIYNDSGSIGQRYRRQDGVGTPLCITIDHGKLGGDGADTVTVRERDGGKQVWLPVDNLVETLVGLCAGIASFDDVLGDNEIVET